MDANEKVDRNLIPDTLYIGLHADWYYGYEGMKRPAICNHGMAPGAKSQFQNDQNRRDSIYLATMPSRARMYANLYSRPLVLEIDTTQLEDEFYHDPLDVAPIGTFIQVAYRDSIPVTAIKETR